MLTENAKHHELTSKCGRSKEQCPQSNVYVSQQEQVNSGLFFSLQQITSHYD